MKCFDLHDLFLCNSQSASLWGPDVNTEIKECSEYSILLSQEPLIIRSSWQSVCLCIVELCMSPTDT